MPSILVELTKNRSHSLAGYFDEVGFKQPTSLGAKGPLMLRVVAGGATSEYPFEDVVAISWVP